MSLKNMEFSQLMSAVATHFKNFQLVTTVHNIIQQVLISKIMTSPLQLKKTRHVLKRREGCCLTLFPGGLRLLLLQESGAGPGHHDHGAPID